MSAAELLLGPGATGAGVTDVPWFGPIIGMLCVAPPVLVGIDAFSAPASDRGGSIEGESRSERPLAAHPPGDPELMPRQPLHFSWPLLRRGRPTFPAAGSRPQQAGQPP